MLTFDTCFFEAEKRCGFMVDQTMKTCWAAEMELLSDIDEVCQKYDIPYFVYFGTMLGAVRHKGFIPWDDDIDIALLREDYERLMAVLKKELPEGYVVHNALEDDDATEYWSSVVNSEYISVEPERLHKFHGCPFMVGLDIYPLDFAPDGEDQSEEVRGLFRLIWTTRRMAIRDDLSAKDKQDLQKLIAEVEKKMQVTLDTNKPIVGQLVRLANRLSASVTESDGNDITMYINYAWTPEWKAKKECYNRIDRVPFENIFVPIPVGYHDILTTIYGEYKTPTMGTQSHDYPFYKKQLELLRKMCELKSS